MDELVKFIRGKLTDSRSHLTIVKNTDGFLLRPDTQQVISSEGRLLLLPIKSDLELRIRYELKDVCSSQDICYVISHDLVLAPDLTAKIVQKGTINLTDILPNYSSLDIRRMNQSWENILDLYHNKRTYRIPDPMELQLNDNITLLGESIEDLIKRLELIHLEWNRNETIESISQIVLKAIADNNYDKIRPTINEINNNFQAYLDVNYDALINSSAINKPKLVSKILPFISKKHNRTDKVVLIVVDGMTYWQYLVLERKLKLNGLNPHNDMTMAWMPTITKLSRQAIFRGEAPCMSYQQNPSNESKLWNDFWSSSKQTSYKFNNYEVEYQHGSLLLDDSTKLRVAMVDTDLDDKMHASSDNRDLYSLTKNWADRVVDDILALHEAGYKIYITTDHGSILASNWRPLSSAEKTFLYSDGSRGARHLIYEKESYMSDFIKSNSDISSELKCNQKMLMWRTDKCFKSNDCITHGGSHFLEVVIPFVTI